MMHLDVLVRGIEMKPLALVFVFHIVTAWQLYVEFHFRGTDVGVSTKVAQKVSGVCHSYVFPSGGSRPLVIWNTASRYNPHCAAGENTRGRTICALLEQ
jgi:hypothetical protein